MTVAVLALQGAFIEHEHVLEELGVKTVELRQAADLDQPYDGLILPGGESTVQGKLLRELKMFDPLRKQIADGLPVLGTCAGLILLGSPEHLLLFAYQMILSSLFMIWFVMHDTVRTINLFQQNHTHQLMGECHFRK